MAEAGSDVLHRATDPNPPPLRELHGLQSTMTFERTDRTPFDKGATWSSVRSCRLPHAEHQGRRLIISSRNCCQA
jgi:hypothetical protein